MRRGRRRWWLLSGLVLGGAAVVVLRRRNRSGYEHDEIDSAGGEFGGSDAKAPEQRWSTAETRRDVTPEELSMQARIEQSMAAIRTVWPAVSEDEIRDSEGDLDRLAGRIAEKVEQPREQVRAELDGILAQETGTGSFPAH